MKITRTYPQPDSNLPHIGPRERALAVFKYLLDIEPEVAAGRRWTAERKAARLAEMESWLETARDNKDSVLAQMEALHRSEWEIAPHPLFACIVHSYEQAMAQGFHDEDGTELEPPLVPMLSSEQTVELRAHPYYDGKL